MARGSPPRCPPLRRRRIRDGTISSTMTYTDATSTDATSTDATSTETAAGPTLTELLPATADPDELFDAFSSWAQNQGLALYPAQQEALIEIVSGSNVILSTPTGSGKSMVAVGAHFTALAWGLRTFYTA